MTRCGNVRVANAFVSILEENTFHSGIAQQVAVMLLSRNTQGCDVDLPQQL